MTYQVLARKWRPQTFDAVVGQEAITRTLRNALASGRVAHAYLFAGPRGIGKTTTARLLARALLCPARTGPEACGACEVCRDAGAVDVIEIDGASNRGIEEIRTLRDNVKYAPARGRFKVYIIDEVHQLTDFAFNALLKTLEEPPPHIVFVLATTDPSDIPATVLSRVQRFDFRPIPPDELTGTLERILGEERVPFDPGALPVIVRTAQGSLRDALSLLDTAIAYGNGRLDAELTAALLGSTAPARIREFAAALIDHDPATALEAIDRAAREGEDLGAFARDVIELLRLALVLTAAPGARLPELTSVESNELRKLGESVSLDEILYVLRAFLDADEMMRESPHPRVELEIATVRATRRPVPQALEEVLRRVDEAEARLRQQALAPGPRGQAQDSLLPLPEEAPSRSPASGGGAPGTRLEAGARRSGGTATALADPRPGGAQRAVAAVDPPPRVAGAAPEASASADLATAWQRVVDDVMKKKPMLSAVLAQARPRGVSAGVLSLSVTGNHFHREMLSDLAARDLITQAVRRWVADADRFEVVAAEEVSGGPTAHPGVQAVIAEFEGEVVAVRARTPEGEGQ